MRPITLTTAGVSNSRPARMDDWAPGPIAIQCVVTGTVAYTVQFSNDDPNSTTNPVANEAAMTWSPSPDAAAVAATGSILTQFASVPLFVRISQATGTGSVVATVVQAGVGPR